MKTLLAQWQAAVWRGLAVILPAAVSVGIIIWLFGLVANFTDTLLLLVPKDWTHARNSEGPMPLYWSVIAFALAFLLVGLVGRLARYYLGQKLIQLVDAVMLRVPLLNRIYRVLKQINEALNDQRVATFKQVVLVEFPRPGLYSLGFITGTQNGEVHAKTGETLVSVFVPTPPLTSGAIVLTREDEVVKLNMSVADGIKFIMSLGAVSPAYPVPATLLSTDMAGSDKPGGFRNDAAMAPARLDGATRFEGEGGPGAPAPFETRPALECA
jgi:uncharacterized membrane protein